MIGLILLIPGIYLLWFAYGREEFFREKRWENWKSRLILTHLLGPYLLLSFLYRFGGARLVKCSFVTLALICIATGLWAMTAN